MAEYKDEKAEDTEDTGSLSSGHADLSEKQKKAICNRIAKAIGHTRSICNMVEDGRDCSEVLIQLSAVKAAVNSTGKELLKLYLSDLLNEAARTHDYARMKELNRVIEMFLK